MEASLIGTVVSHLFGALGIEKHVVMGEHHESQGRIERMNQTIQIAIKCQLDQTQDWLVHLDSVIFALNLTPIGPGGETPYLLHFNRPPRTLASVITPLPPPHKSKTLETYIEGLAPQLKRITDIAHNNAFLAQQELKARFDKKAATPTFVVGQEVYLDSPHVPAGYSRKLQNRFKRRFVITERKTFTNFCVKDKLTNKELKYPVHCSRFRKVEDDKSTLSHLGPELIF